MTRRVGDKWAALSWQVVEPGDTPPGDVEARLVTPQLDGGGRIVVRFGVRVVDPGDGSDPFEVLAPTAITVEGEDGDHVSPASVAALRTVPLVALIDSARVVARKVLRDRVRGSGGAADALDAALIRFAEVRHLGPSEPEFLNAFDEVVDLATRTHPEKPLTHLAAVLGVGRSTVGRWASAARAAR